MNLAMIRANQRTFFRIVAILRQYAVAEAAAMQSARRQKEQKAADERLVGQLRNWEAWIKTLPSRAEDLIAYADRVDTAYLTITEQMRVAYAHEQSLYAGPSTTYARGQVFFWIGQRAFRAGNIHFSVRMHQANVFASMKRAENVTGRLAQSCQARDRSPKVPRFVLRACTAFLDRIPILAKNNDAIASAFRRAEAVWAQQRLEQKAIEWRAERAARY